MKYVIIQQKNCNNNQKLINKNITTMNKMKNMVICICVTIIAFILPSSPSTFVHSASLRSKLNTKASTILNLNGELVARDEETAFTIDLTRSRVSHKKKVRFLMALKSSHQSIQAANNNNNNNNNNGETSFIALSDEPLQEQVLSEKRLATYFGSVQIGECVDGDKKVIECTQDKKDKLTFKMLFDTGSCEFWIPGIGCSKADKYADRCSNHRTYDPLLSESYQNKVNGAGPFSEDQKMCIQYLSGKVEGFMAKDTITIGDLKVHSQVFGMADTIDVPLLDEVVWDGIIGLAYPNQKLNDQGVTPLVDNMMKKKTLQNNVFAYYIGQSSGAVTFGGVDKKFFAGTDNKFRYAAVTEKTYWTIELMDIELQYGNKEVTKTGVCKNQPNSRCKAIVDTGTYLIYGPREHVTGPLKDLTVGACSDIDKLPKVTFIMYAGEGQTPARLTLHPRDYVLEFTVPVETQSVFLEEGLKAGTKHLASADGVNCADPANKADPKKCTKDCVIGIGPDNDPGWTLGQVFLRSFYTVFDRDTDRVGFIRNNPKANTGAPNPLEGSIQTTLLSSDGSKIGGNGKLVKQPGPRL
tara:strand:- start:1654 stop:3396 length:1743 start_codon:yes stop_codon:yes gene_type:complete